MLIQSLLKRHNGTHVQLRNTNYHFKPEDTALKAGTPDFLAAPHVAEVEDQRDMAALLAVPEGYALFLPEAPVAKKPAAKKPAAVEAAAAGVITDNSEQTELKVIKDEDAPAVVAAPATDAIDPALKARYVELAGRQPHHKWKADRIAAEIADLEAK